MYVFFFVMFPSFLFWYFVRIAVDRKLSKHSKNTQSTYAQQTHTLKRTNTVIINIVGMSQF